MPLAIYTSAAWTANGGIEPAAGATVEVRSEATGSLVSLFEDRDGEVGLDNPFTTDAQGRFAFFVSGGAYRVKVTDGENEHTLRWQAVGTAQEFDATALAQQVDSVEDLRAATFPASLQRLWLSGYYGVGTAGGGPLYRKGDGYTESDENGILWVDADGIGWEAGPGFVLAEDATLRVPSRFDTLQEAIDETSHYQVTQGVTIDLLIESGHQPESGVEVERGDYSYYQISSEDAEVILPSTFSSNGMVVADYCDAPILNCLVDSQGNSARGYRILGGRGRVNSGCGVKNTTGEGLWIYHCQFDGDGSVWSGSKGYAIRASRGAIFNASGVDLTNCDAPDNPNGLVYVNRGSIGNMQLADLSGSQAGSRIFYIHRTSILNAHNIVANGISASNACFMAARNSNLDINESTVTNISGVFVKTRASSVVNASNMEVPVTSASGNTSNAIEIDQVSTATLVGTVIDGFGGTGIEVDNGSSVFGGAGTEVLNCDRGIECLDGSRFSGPGTVVQNSGDLGVYSNNGSSVCIRAGSVTGSGSDDLLCANGSFIDANGTTTTNGAGSPDPDDTNPGTYNDLSGRGVIWA